MMVILLSVVEETSCETCQRIQTWNTLCCETVISVADLMYCSLQQECPPGSQPPVLQTHDGKLMLPIRMIVSPVEELKDQLLTYPCDRSQQTPQHDAPRLSNLVLPTTCVSVSVSDNARTQYQENGTSHSRSKNNRLSGAYTSSYVDRSNARAMLCALMLLVLDNIPKHPQLRL